MMVVRVGRARRESNPRSDSFRDYSFTIKLLAQILRCFFGFEEFWEYPVSGLVVQFELEDCT